MTLSKRKIMPLLFGLLFMLNASTVFGEAPTYSDDDLGVFSGTIVQENGTPFSGFVAFFSSEESVPMDYGSSRRSPKMISFTDDEGKFTTHLMPAGSYYIGAMERKGWRGGPPEREETRYSAFDEKGGYVVVSLKGGETKDIGAITVKKPTSFPELKDFFTIKGRLLDGKGKGVFDSVVVVKKNYDERKALFISDKSSIDGSFEIKLPPGKFFIIARETVAGTTRPKPGSIYGELGQEEPLGIGGKTSRLPTYIVGVKGQVYNDVTITMFKVPIPEVKRKETEEKIKSNKMEKKNLPDNLPLMKKKADDAVKSPIRPEEAFKK